VATATKSRKTTKTDVLNVAFVWDMSGSMASVDGATREGTRGYLMDLAKEEKKLVKKNGEGIYTRFSLMAFDTAFEQWLDDMPISEISIDAIINEYQPRGGTALYDAIANTITTLASRLKGDRKNEKCLVIVMTDGHENASKEYSLRENGKKRLFDLIKAYEKKGNWTFVYLGANVDSFAEAAAIGIPQGNAAYYSASPVSVNLTAASLTGVTKSRRASASASSDVSFADANLIQDYRDEDDKK
jgi:von Willebrand factor type A domain